MSSGIARRVDLPV